MKITTKTFTLEFAEDFKSLLSLQINSNNRELLSKKQPPIFTVEFRGKDGSENKIASSSAKLSTARISGCVTEITYSGFEIDISVIVTVKPDLTSIHWGIRVENRSELAVEYIDFPSVSYEGKLIDNGGDASILFPYNEGLLVTDSSMKTTMIDPVYPSMGIYTVFPNMVFAQFSAYLFGNSGIYMGLHDPRRAPKGIDFYCRDNGSEFRTRLFMGGEFGSGVASDYDIIWQYFDGNWYDAAEIYRSFFTANLPDGLSADRLFDSELPKWYTDGMPLVVAYPVRGIHDMDEMKPNRLFPYNNALGFIDEIARRTKSQILVLLMHWEGTAPWAPPYVWPPYGGVEMLADFMRKLHDRGDLLGVYCSGFGYTEQSNLIAEYNKKAEFDERGLRDGMCLAPDQSLPHSKICTDQRSGYDICPASEVGRKLLCEAVKPLLDFGLDYIQILDQNHGGGMYLCYSQNHGHPPVPGVWMTEANEKLLSQWKSQCPNTLLGCESSAAEPFIPSLRLSDNRYELNYEFGHPVPLYAYLYHRWLHNFMGNQVHCMLENSTLSLNMRIAYSFAAGDLITFVINDAGAVMFQWGMRDFSRNPDMDSVLGLTAELHRWHEAYPELFRDAQMIKPLEFDCGSVRIPLSENKMYCEKAVFSTAWSFAGRNVQLFVNYTDEPQTCRLYRNKLKLKPTPDAVFKDTSGEFTIAPRSVCAVEY